MCSYSKSTCSVKVSSRCVSVAVAPTGSDVECVSGMPMSEQPSIRALSAENPSLWTRTLRTDMRRGIPLSRTEFRIFWKFLLSWYCRKAVWILQAARREMRGPPYFCSNSSICIDIKRELFSSHHAKFVFRDRENTLIDVALPAICIRSSMETLK